MRSPSLRAMISWSYRRPGRRGGVKRPFAGLPSSGTVEAVKMVLLRGQTLKRREFIGIMAGAATWPLNVRAQESPRVRHIGVLLYSKDDRTTIITPFLSGLQALGHIDGKNVTIEYRYGDGNFETSSKTAEELVRLNPDV